MASPIEIFKKSAISDNPVFIQALGMCPTLAVTTSAINGLGMGFATTAVLIGSNVAISILRKAIPNTVRIPAFIVVIASFVTIIQLLLKGFVPALDKSLGLFIPLIVVNCCILGRAEAFAFKNNPFNSLIDGLGTGVGFALALTIIGSIREFLGNGTIFGLEFLPETFPKTLIMIMPPGAFITLGILMAVIKYNQIKREERA